jgi:hypothetical protein
MDSQQRRRFAQAVERKQAEAEERSRSGGDDVGEETRRPGGQEDEIADASRPPGTVDPRAKSSRHGQVTADKWNQ